MCVSQWEKERSKKQKENKIRNVFSYSFSFTFQQTHSHTHSLLLWLPRSSSSGSCTASYECALFLRKSHFLFGNWSGLPLPPPLQQLLSPMGKKRVSLTKWKKDRKRERKTFKHYRTLLLQTGATTATVSADQRRPFVVYWLSLFLFLFHSHFLSFSLFLFKVWRPHKTARLCTGRLAHRFLLERERDKE